MPTWLGRVLRVRQDDRGLWLISPSTDKARGLLLDYLGCSGERGGVAGIGDDQRAVVAEAADHHRGKTIGRKQRTQKRVQPQHRARWIVLRDLLELLLDHRHDDGSVDSFSCHVSQREPHAPIGGMHEVDIAGERARGDGDRVHVRCAGRLQPAGVKQLQLDHATFGWHR